MNSFANAKKDHIPSYIVLLAVRVCPHDAQVVSATDLWVRRLVLGKGRAVLTSGARGVVVTHVQCRCAG